MKPCLWCFFFRDKIYNSSSDHHNIAAIGAGWCWRANYNVRSETRMVEGSRSVNFRSHRRRSAASSAIWPWQLSRSVPQPPSSTVASPKRPYIRDQRTALEWLLNCARMLHIYASMKTRDTHSASARSSIACTAVGSCGLAWALVLQVSAPWADGSCRLWHKYSCRHCCSSHVVTAESASPQNAVHDRRKGL